MSTFRRAQSRGRRRLNYDETVDGLLRPDRKTIVAVLASDSHFTCFVISVACWSVTDTVFRRIRRGPQKNYIHIWVSWTFRWQTSSLTSRFADKTTIFILIRQQGSNTYKQSVNTKQAYVHNTRSSSMVTLARPPTRSSLKITIRSFRYAASCPRNELPTDLREPRQTQSPALLPITHGSSSSFPSSLSLLASFFS